MATNIFLGFPPENIKQFIIENYGQKDMTKVPLHFTANEDNSSVSLVCYDNSANDYEGDFTDSLCKLDYSMDGKTWQTYIDPDSEDETLHRGKVINLNKDETVYFKATLGDVEGNPNLNGFGYYNEDEGDVLKWHYFAMKGSIKADGNIQFLLENTGTKIDVPNDYCYSRMFHNCINDYNTALTQAPVLPATELANYCYYEMFSGCTSLIKAPALPATSLAERCYSNMFSGCTSLTQAPVLPAETLIGGCYISMFRSCTSLTQAPELPAKELADNCYLYMFSGCTSLIKAPALPATSLADSCYSYMFSDCSSLTQAPVLPATELANYCYRGMFRGCTSLTQAPELPATALADYCYHYMFSDCSSLTQAPVLPATTLANYCYYQMFHGCTNLNSINVNFSAWNPTSATYFWVTNVSSSGTFTCPTDLPKEFGDNRIPTGWSVNP